VVAEGMTQVQISVDEWMNLPTPTSRKQCAHDKVLRVSSSTANNFVSLMRYTTPGLQGSMAPSVGTFPGGSPALP